MPLPSQSSRVGMSGSVGGPRGGSVYRGGRRRRASRVPMPIKAAGGVAVLALVVWGVWAVLPGSSEANDGAAGDGAGDGASGAVVDPIVNAGATPSPRSPIDDGARTNASAIPADPGPMIAEGTPRDTGRSDGSGLLGGALRGGNSESTRANAGAPSRTPSRAGLVGDTVRTAIETARAFNAANDPVSARSELNAALQRVGRDGAGAGALRAELMELNQDLVFGPRVVRDDAMASMYVVQPGDALSRIASRETNGTHWKLIQRVNRLGSPNTIRVGQSLKLIQGPFHAVVDKSDYRLDMYHGEADAPELWTYITSFPVGLGEEDSTPAGRFVVRSAGKLENPAWVNPRNPRERYTGDDPENPIGEFWVGIDGLGDDAVHTGLGLHGTIEPESIGTQASMGCVRLGADDVALVYELLSEGESLVTIVE